MYHDVTLKIAQGIFCDVFISSDNTHCCLALRKYISTCTNVGKEEFLTPATYLKRREFRY